MQRASRFALSDGQRAEWCPDRPAGQSVVAPQRSLTGPELLPTDVIGSAAHRDASRGDCCARTCQGTAVVKPLVKSVMYHAEAFAL
jgi:hypothetical protein